MVAKDTMTLAKPWSAPSAGRLSFSALFARLKKAVSFEIPVGYQDETGFHVGEKPDEKGIRWPAVS